MEYINAIEIQGVTGQFATAIHHAGEPIGIKFEVATETRYKIGDKPVVDTMWHTVKVLTLPGTRTAGFTFRKAAPIHVRGRLAFKSAGSDPETGIPVFRNVTVEASSAEYLDEKKEG